MGMAPDGEPLLTIGEFSRVSRLSIRMLRHYDEHGVLHATFTDPRSGYRYYDPALLVPAGRVRSLRDVGLGVAELAACAPHLDDPDRLRQALAQQRARLDADAATVAERRSRLEALVAELGRPGPEVVVGHRHVPAATVASLRDVIPSYPDEGLLWARLTAGLPATDAVAAPTGHPAAVYHDEGFVEQEPDVEVRLPVVARFTGTAHVRCVEVAAHDAAVGTLTGPGFEEIGPLLGAIGRWVTEQGYRMAGPTSSVYLVGRDREPDPSAWVTEVHVPVAALDPATV